PVDDVTAAGPGRGAPQVDGADVGCCDARAHGARAEIELPHDGGRAERAAGEGAARDAERLAAQIRARCDLHLAGLDTQTFGVGTARPNAAATAREAQYTRTRLDDARGGSAVEIAGGHLDHAVDLQSESGCRVDVHL